MKPAQTKTLIDRPTALESFLYGYSTLSSSLDKWQSRSDTLSVFKALIDNTSGKVAEWGTYFMYVPRFSDLDKPDHKEYKIGEKSFKEDMETKAGNAKLAVKNKELSMAKKYGINATFSSNDPEIFGPNRNNDLYVIQTVADVNVSYNGSLPTMKLDNVSVAMFYCIKVGWLHKHNLFYDTDRQQSSKKTVIYTHGPVVREGVRTVLDVIETEYGGDRSHLWQL